MDIRKVLLGVSAIPFMSSLFIYFYTDLPSYRPTYVSKCWNPGNNKIRLFESTYPTGDVIIVGTRG